MNAMKLTKEEIVEGITCEVERGKCKLTQKLKRKEMGGG